MAAPRGDTLNVRRSALLALVLVTASVFMPMLSFDDPPQESSCQALVVDDPSVGSFLRWALTVIEGQGHRCLRDDTNTFLLRALV
jgi:hypothetical protein